MSTSTSTSSTSGATSTSAKLVWRRCAASNGEMPHQPVDALLGREQPVGVLAAGDEGRRLDAGLLPRADASISSTLKPRRSAQRISMRSSISAQSCESVPPAPACARSRRRRPRRSGPEKRRCLLELREPRARSRRAAPRARRAIDSSSAGQLLERLEVVELGLERAEASRACAGRAACSADTCAARSWSSQKPGACISSSSSLERAPLAQLGQR